MTQQIQPLHRLMGLNPTGDLAGVTFYTDKRRGIVYFPKHTLAKVPSPAQSYQRNLFRRAAEAWQNLQEATRAKWELATKLLRLKLTGYDLWIVWQLRHDRPMIETIENDSGLDLLSPEEAI